MSKTAIVQPDSLSPTGIPGLDNVLAGGLTRDRIYLIEGDPGAGKTTLALQYLLEGEIRGERGLYVTLSETGAELRAVGRSHGWDRTDALDIREFVISEDALATDAQVTMFHPSEVELTETIRHIIDAVESARPVRVVIDSLSELRLLSQNALRYRRQVLALKQFFMGRESTVLLLDDLASEGPGQLLRSVAHGVIELKQFTPEYGSDRRRLRVIKLRGRSYRGGFHDYEINTGGIEIFPRLVAAEHHAAFDGTVLPSGVPQLDALLGGGPARGTTTLLLGPAGAGKTTVAMQYVSAAATRGLKSAVFIFDETLGTLVARSEATRVPVREHIASGTVKITQVDPAELSPGEFAHAVRVAVEVDGVRVVVLDSLNGYMFSMPEERLLTAHLHELFTFLNQKGVVTFVLVAQAGLVGPMNSPVDASYLADSIVLFRFFEAAGRVRRAISVMKKRAGRHEDTIRELHITDTGVRLGEPLSEFRGILSGIPVLNGEPVVGA